MPTLRNASVAQARALFPLRIRPLDRGASAEAEAKGRLLASDTNP